MIRPMDDGVLATIPPAASRRIIRTLRDNRDHLQVYLDHGTITGRGGFRKALKQFDQAIEGGSDWAVRLAIEYSVGKPPQYIASMQLDDDGGDSIAQTVDTIEETVTVARRQRRVTTGD